VYKIYKKKKGKGGITPPISFIKHLFLLFFPECTNIFLLYLYMFMSRNNTEKRTVLNKSYLPKNKTFNRNQAKTT